MPGTNFQSDGYGAAIPLTRLRECLQNVCRMNAECDRAAVHDLVLAQVCPCLRSQDRIVEAVESELLCEIR